MTAITLETAQSVLAQLSEEIISSHAAPVSVAICCPAGEPIAAIRMDGVTFRTMHLALAKGYSAAYREASTLSFRDFLTQEKLTPGDFMNPRLTALPGGVPIKVKGKTIGSIGISGRLPIEDHELASALAEKIQKLCEKD